MKTKTEVKVEPISYYIKSSAQTNFGEKIVAEYDTRNHNLRIYVYEGDIIARAYYDDNNDGKIETYFSNGVGYSRERSSKESTSFLDSILDRISGDRIFASKALEEIFNVRDTDFRQYKRLLHIDNAIAAQRLYDDAAALAELFK